MFKLIIQLLFIIYIIFLIYNLIELKKYNKNGHIINCDKSDINENINSLNPLYFNIKHNYKTELDLEKNYFKNNDIINDINYDSQYLKDIIDKDMLIYNESLTFYKSDMSSELNICKHNFTIVSILNGKCKLYLINPKHKNDIISKKNNEIKKWSHIIFLEKYDNILIPSNWQYFIETEKGVTISHLDCDNYFTIIPNFIKEIFNL